LREGYLEDWARRTTLTIALYIGVRSVKFVSKFCKPLDLKQSGYVYELIRKHHQLHRTKELPMPILRYGYTLLGSTPLFSACRLIFMSAASLAYVTPADHIIGVLMFCRAWPQRNCCYTRAPYRRGGLRLLVYGLMTGRRRVTDKWSLWSCRRRSSSPQTTTIPYLSITHYSYQVHSGIAVPSVVDV
jgi:hypothetical protein